MATQTLRPLPDPEISLRDARDFIISSALARRALNCGLSSFPLFVHDLLEVVYRLVQSCHLPEFTDHGLPHLCSLVDRASRWELPPGPNGRVDVVSDTLEPNEAAILLVAILVHDIGMLSQNPLDLPEEASELQSKALWPDVATWVRHTHVSRLEKLVRRVVRANDYAGLLDTDQFNWAIDVAKSHQQWPWEWNGAWTANARLRGLASILAIVDLLDEDSARCDTATLLKHREGNQSNRAHWLRHALTENRVIVRRGRIAVSMVRPPGTGIALRPVYSALRNHFRLILLYEADLGHVGAPITNIALDPATGLPDREIAELADWQRISGFGTETALAYQLLRTFMAPVLKDSRRLSGRTLSALRVASLEDVDIEIFNRCEGVEESRSEYEQTFQALVGNGM